MKKVLVAVLSETWMTVYDKNLLEGYKKVMDYDYEYM